MKVKWWPLILLALLLACETKPEKEAPQPSPGATLEWGIGPRELDAGWSRPPVHHYNVTTWLDGDSVFCEATFDTSYGGWAFLDTTRTLHALQFSVSACNDSNECNPVKNDNTSDVRYVFTKPLENRNGSPAVGVSEDPIPARRYFACHWSPPVADR